jgi:hypothetical protein
MHLHVLLLLLSLPLWNHLPLLLQVLILGLDSGASFHMVPHSSHLSSLRPSYRQCIIHTTDGSPLSVTGQGTLSSDSFHVPNVSLIPDLIMHLMFAGQITDHDCRVILDPDVCYIQDRHTGHLVGTGVRHHNSQCLWELD